MGNITRIEKGGVVVASYAYDALNQLVSATQNGVTYLYQYDNGGNITGRSTSDGNGAFYTYGDTTWRDLLTAYNGQAITYDAIGNPLTYRGGMSFTWEGRQMQTATVGDSSIAYTYDVDGYRTTKTIDGVKTTYVLDGSKVIMEQTGSDSPIYFTYDVNGRPITMTVGSAVYYYVYNLQGDVIAVTNNNGMKVVEYTYNPWGKITAITGDSASTIGVQNPYRYRGYRYDTETGLYYLNSRYYDPETGRFINADGLVSTGQGVLGFNMFAYCGNNPVNMIDPSGHLPKWLEDLGNWINNNIIEPVVGFVEDIVEDFSNYDSGNQSEDVVFSSNYFSNYKGTLVIKTPFDASFSFGIIGLSRLQENPNTLKHEYGHKLQMDNMGILSYTFNVAIPSATINILERFDKLPYDYYSYPWEAEANKLGGAVLSQRRKPRLPQGGYTSYWDLIQLFFK